MIKDYFVGKTGLWLDILTASNVTILLKNMIVIFSLSPTAFGSAILERDLGQKCSNLKGRIKSPKGYC